MPQADATATLPVMPKRRPESVLVSALDSLIWLYQKTVSPALAVALPSCGCRFAPTCSHYAREALREHGFIRGTVLAIRRLARCGPWHPGGIDLVPKRCTRVGVTLQHRSRSNG